jgi:hypothetical protein
MISSPDVTRYHTANFIKQRGVIPTEIYILKHNFFLQDQSIRGKLFSIETRTWYPHHFFKTLGPASSIMVQSSALSLYLPHYKLLIRWCAYGVSRSQHGAKVHDKHEEHRISHQITPRQKTINVCTRSTTKTPRQHAVQQLITWSAPPGKGCVKVFLAFTRDLHDAGTLRSLQIRKSWCSRRHLVDSL